MGTINFLLFILVVSLFTSCKPKYEELIDNHMKEHLHDYSSYEPISFEVDTIMRIVDTNFRHLLIRTEFELLCGESYVDSYKELTDKQSKEVEKAFRDYKYSYGHSSATYFDIYEVQYDLEIEYRNKYAMWVDSCVIIKYKLDSLNIIGEGMDKEVASFSIKHKYRANNGHGALRLGTTKFIIDKDMTEIRSSEIIKD